MSELVYPDSATAQLATINSDVSVVTSIDASNRAGAIKLFNATADAEPLNEHLGEILYITDYVMEPITVTNEETGEATTAIRTVIIDKDGVAYNAISEQLFKSLRRLFAMIGHPQTWKAPVPLIVTEQKSSGPRRFFKLTIADAPAAK